MTIRQIIGSWLAKPTQHPRQARRDALDRLQRARSRLDTRGEGEALRALRIATHDLMRAELRLVK